MIQRTFQTFRIAEANHKINKGTAARVAVAAILEAGAAAFHKSYYGLEEWGKAGASISREEKQGTELLGIMQEAMLSDLTRTRSVLREAHTTTDFPIILANLRQRVMRDELVVGDSILPKFAESRPVSDFKLIKGVTIGGIGDLTEQAEAESVDYATFDYTEDSYCVKLVSLAMRLTYQMIKNDDIGLFTRGFKQLGISARRARALACVRAIRDGLTVQQLASAAGGPTVARLEAAYNYQAGQTRTVDGQARPNPRIINTIVVPPAWTMTAKTALNSEKVNQTGAKEPTANPVQGMGELFTDVILGEVLGKDWLCFDRSVPFLELAVLDDFAAGPRTVTKLPDQVSDPNMGDFDDMTSSVKVMDATAAKVISTKDALRVDGE